MSSVQLCRQGGHDPVSAEVNSYTLPHNYKPLTSEPLKDYVHVCCVFSPLWFIPCMKNADFVAEVSYNTVCLVHLRMLGYYMTDIMSSLCHAPCKSPRKHNKRKITAGLICIDSWFFGKREVYTFPPSAWSATARQRTLSEKESRLVSLTTFHLALHFKEIQETPLIAYSISALIWGRVYCSLQELSLDVFISLKKANICTRW